MTIAEKYGIVILAAGSSSRLGQPKQLLKFQQRSLLQHTIDAAVKTTGKQVIVVTGAHKELIEGEVSKSPVHVVYNEYWQEGMASSIYIGLINLLKIFPQVESIIFSVCDQPFISGGIFRKLIKKQKETGKGIIAAVYNDTTGIPALFSNKYFYDLLHLNGQEGAKILLKKYVEDVEHIPFKNGNIDIDTIDNYNKLIESY